MRKWEKRIKIFLCWELWIINERVASSSWAKYCTIYNSISKTYELTYMLMNIQDFSATFRPFRMWIRRKFQFLHILTLVNIYGFPNLIKISLVCVYLSFRASCNVITEWMRVTWWWWILSNRQKHAKMNFTAVESEVSQILHMFRVNSTWKILWEQHL